MKRLLLSMAAIFITFAAFSQKPAPAVKGAIYGEKVKEKGAIPVTQLGGKMGETTELSAKVSGKVVDVCEKKGCFMKLDLENGESMMVRFKDYGFFVPTDIRGKTVVIEGLAKQETLSVDDLKHYAADAKKSAEEIAKITEPKKQVTFEATGVVVL